MAEEKKEIEQMSLVDFANELLRLNNLGRDLTLHHKDVYGATPNDKVQNGKRHHQPALMADCPDCKKIIETHDAYMKLTMEQIGLTGIPFDALMSAIKVTRATVRMMKKGGEI